MDIGTYLSNVHLLRPTRIGSFLRSFRLHSPRYARETIAESCSIWVALATAIISQAGPRAANSTRLKLGLRASWVKQ